MTPVAWPEAHSAERELAVVVRDRIGLKPALAAQKIEALLRAVPADDRPSFCRDLLGADPAGSVWRGFAEALLVHETYFFRHPDQLQLLAEVVLPRLLQERLDTGSRTIRVWSAGCSSGEEVYTVALLLQGAIARSPLPDAQAWNATVLGTDVSAVTLGLARRGSYELVAGLNSFRDVPAFARHHFSAIFGAAQTTWSAGGELRRVSRFVPHNLVTDPCPLSDADLVLCRNTLIYFEEAQTRVALTCLEAALRPGGVLLLGPAETAAEASSLRMVCTDQAVYWTKKRAGE